MKMKKLMRKKIKKEGLYIEVEDGWYSVFGGDSGKCYAQYGSEEQAKEYVERQTSSK
jgi:hypothetical protein